MYVVSDYSADPALLFMVMIRIDVTNLYGITLLSRVIECHFKGAFETKGIKAKGVRAGSFLYLFDKRYAVHGGLPASGTRVTFAQLAGAKDVAIEGKRKMLLFFRTLI